MKKGLAIFIFIFCASISYTQNEYDNDSPETEDEEFVGFDKQKKERKDWVKRLRVGGDIGFAFGSNGYGFQLSPLIGYQVVEDRVEIGTGIVYEFYKYNSIAKEQIVGTNNYLRLYIWEGVFAQFRGIYVRDKIKFDNGDILTLKTGNAFAGAGYSFQIGRNSAFNLGLEVNLIEYEFEPKRRFNPFLNFQIGF